MGEDKVRVLDHSSNIFYHMAIGTMILCYLWTLILSFDILSFFGSFVVLAVLGAIWVLIAAIGCVSFLIVAPSYRLFLMDIGNIFVKVLGSDSSDIILDLIRNISPYYVLFAILPPIAITLFFVTRKLANKLKNLKGKILTLSIMGFFYMVSLVISIVLIVRLQGGSSL